MSEPSAALFQAHPGISDREWLGSRRSFGDSSPGLLLGEARGRLAGLSVPGGLVSVHPVVGNPAVEEEHRMLAVVRIDPVVDPDPGAPLLDKLGTLAHLRRAKQSALEIAVRTASMPYIWRLSTLCRSPGIWRLSTSWSSRIRRLPASWTTWVWGLRSSVGTSSALRRGHFRCELGVQLVRSCGVN